MQHERVRNPHPWTFEIPVACVLAVVLVMVLGVHAGRATANLLAGGGLAWPHPTDLFSSLPALLGGDATAGLAKAPAQVASPAALRAWIIVAETVTLVLVGVCAAGAMKRWGPGRLRGMADKAEATTLLGGSRLRRHRAVIRPDLHRKGHPMSLRPRFVRGMDPRDLGWNLGRSTAPAGVDLWVPWDRTAGVIGPQGSGKTLDLLTPALLDAPGAALVTLTKPEDLLLTFTARSSDGRPCVVLDPFGLVPGLPELVWDPIAGCVDAVVAERRAKAFTAGTVKGAVAEGYGDQAARFYAAEAAKVIQAYFHAAALAGRNLDDVLEWVTDPRAAIEPAEILRTHPQAAQFWHGLLHGALHGDERTAGNTVTTVQQALSLFFQEPMRRRCVPGPGRPATDIGQLLARGGTIYLLGREDPYASASPLMTALTEHVLDTALGMAQRSGWGRLCPPMLACLDELPSTAPLPTLRTRMANERALGLSFIWAAQTRAQLDSIFGQAEARAVLGLTNNLVIFGGSKDVAFNQEVSDLIGKVRIGRSTWNTGQRGGRSFTGEDIPILTGPEIRQIKERHALVISENGRPVMARLHRCIDGHAGKALLGDQAMLREQTGNHRAATITPQIRATAALAAARQHGLIAPRFEQ